MLDAQIDLARENARLRRQVKSLSRIVALGLDYALQDALDREHRSPTTEAAANRARARFVEHAQRKRED